MIGQLETAWAQLRRKLPFKSSQLICRIDSRVNFRCLQVCVTEPQRNFRGADPICAQAAFLSISMAFGAPSRKRLTEVLMTVSTSADVGMP